MRLEKIAFDQHVYSLAYTYKLGVAVRPLDKGPMPRWEVIIVELFKGEWLKVATIELRRDTCAEVFMREVYVNWFEAARKAYIPF